MKVLFVNSFRAPDYQSDMVYHGLIDSMLEVYESDNPAYMLESFPNPRKLYGKGFSLYAKLKHRPHLDPTEEILRKIDGRFYDLIVYGSVHRDLRWLSHVLRSYKPNEIIFIDGEDSVDFREGLIGFGLYFKRECVNSYVHPITFGIPESQVLKTSVVKSKTFANIIPGKPETYVYDSEMEYYRDYQDSYYGVTCKKAGWDCLRHYEILANRCIPYFPDLAFCPTQTLQSFPKEVVIETNRYARKAEIHPEYIKINNLLLDFTIRHLTTKSIVKNLLNYL